MLRVGEVKTLSTPRGSFSVPGKPESSEKDEFQTLGSLLIFGADP
jgi:hypothetical protein